MDLVNLQSSTLNRNVTPTRNSQKRDNGQENDAAEQLSQAAARRRAQEQQAEQAQQARQQRQAEQLAERSNQRFSGRLVRFGDNRGIENTEQARAEVMRDKVQKVYSTSSQSAADTQSVTFDNSGRAETDAVSDSSSASQRNPIDLVV